MHDKKPNPRGVLVGGRKPKYVTPRALRRVALTEQLTFRLCEADAERLRAMATAGGLGQSTLVRRIVEEYVRNWDA